MIVERVVAATSFLKWAGSKRVLVPELLKRLPAEFGRYFEPFVGGGSLFFALNPERAVIGDLNVDLVNVYRALKGDVDGVIRHLRRHARLHSSEHYYRMRDQWNENRTSWSTSKRASAFLYFNKTCFNGLWRVNASGLMNVPMGRYEKPTICDQEMLHSASKSIQRAELRAGDYKKTLDDVERGDLVYIDSPHHVRSMTSSFTAYTAGAFNEQDQTELADVARQLARRGCHVILSNADLPFIRTLYKGFKIDRVPCPRLINSKAAGRGDVNELIIVGTS